MDEQRYIHEVAEAMGFGNSTIDKWTRLPHQERQGKLSIATHLTPDQFEFVSQNLR